MNIKNKYTDRVLKDYDYRLFDDSLINKDGWVLDLGCAGFQLTNYFINKGCNVIALDPVPATTVPDNENLTFMSKCCVGIKKSETKTFYEYWLGGANSLYFSPDKFDDPKCKATPNNPFKQSFDVQLTTIAEIMDEYAITQFELIKIDIEGAEYEILANLPSKCSKQLSIEFHEWMGLNPYDDIEDYHKNILSNQLSDYSLVYDNLSPMEGTDAFSRDDCLYILKDLL